MKKVILPTLFSCMMLVSNGIHAQNDRIHIGLLGGYRMNSVSYSNLDGRYFPSPEGISNVFGGLFMEFEFGYEGNFSIRPELAYKSRAHKITGLNMQGDIVGKPSYELNAKFVDIRMPLIFNIGQHDNVRPYLFASPVLGITTGGDIKIEDALSSYTVDISDANMSTAILAAAVGVGVKFPISIGFDDMHLGLELCYEFGFTDTYAAKEKDGKAIAYQFFPAYNITGTRKMSGFEAGVTVSLPLSVFDGGVRNTPRRSGRVVVREYEYYY